MNPESRQYFKVLGARITELRKERDMTQAELARAIGVSQQSVFTYELGDRRVSVLMLVKLARLFQISVEELMGIARPQPHSERPSRKWMHHAQRMRGLSKKDQRFVVKIIDVLEQAGKNHRAIANYRNPGDPTKPQCQPVKQLRPTGAGSRPGWTEP